MSSMRGSAKRSGQELAELLEARLRTLAARRPARAFLHARAGVGSRRPVAETGLRHVADRYELCFAVQGEARIVTPQRGFHVRPGQLLIIDPGVDHDEIPAVPPFHYEAFWVAINGVLAQLRRSTTSSQTRATAANLAVTWAAATSGSWTATRSGSRPS